MALTRTPVPTGPIAIPAGPGFPWMRLALLIAVPLLLLLIWVAMGFVKKEPTGRKPPTVQAKRVSGKNLLDGVPKQNLGVAEEDHTPTTPSQAPPAAPAPAAEPGIDKDAIIAKLRSDNQGLNARNRQLEADAKTRTEATAKATPTKMDAQASERLAEAKRRAEERRKEDDEARKSLDVWTAPGDKQKTELKSLPTPYSLPPATEIACATERQLTNQVQGSFRAFVTRPVRAANGAIVIPAMSRLQLRPAGSSVFGDEWMSIQVKTITFPDDTYVEFGQATVGDDQNAAGFKDLVDRRIGTAFVGSIALGALRGGSAVVGTGVGSDASQRVAGAVASETANQSSQQLRQFIRTDPILSIRAQHPCHILLEAPLTLTRSWDTPSP